MSNNEYVPDEDSVQMHYVFGAVRSNPGFTPGQVRAEFDRFLAQVKRDAWQEGAQAQADTYGGQIDTGPNPYEEAA